MPKLFSKPMTFETIKLLIKLPSEAAARLKKLTAEMEAMGLEATLEDAIAAYLIRAIGHAEGELRRTKGGATQANGGS